ncbi:MAG: hypothetical protein VKI82_05350 [Leptolyngbya sp.]|nr:hypothetical protein [Leptolyngbya sp.]
MSPPFPRVIAPVSWQHCLSRAALPLTFSTLAMTHHQRCPHCQNTTLLKLGVPGIRQCSQCKAYVDLRSKGWLTRLIGKKRAA